MKISVIIPVYNVEKYLEECLNSVINQTYSNIEIICVNNCSTDDCEKILEKYRQNDDRIILIKTKKNVGLGLSRNEGIKLATGDYVHVLDSDDFLEINAYNEIINSIENNPDIIYFCHRILNDETGKIEGEKRVKEHYTIGINSKEFLLNNIVNWDNYAWCKLYKKDFLLKNNLYYNDYRCYEDLEYSFKCLINAKSILFLDKVLLTYRHNRKGSILENNYKHIDYVIRSFNTIQEETQNIEKETREKILLHFILTIKYILKDMYENKRINIIDIKNVCKKIDFSIFSKNEKDTNKTLKTLMNISKQNILMLYIKAKIKKLFD